VGGDCAILDLPDDKDWWEAERSVYVRSPIRITCAMAGSDDDFSFEWTTDSGELQGSGHSIVWMAPGHASKAQVTVTARNATGEDDTATLTFRVSTCRPCLGLPPDYPVR